MARFILEYDVRLEKATKMWILDNVNASMVSTNGDSVQFCLADVMNVIGSDENYDKPWYYDYGYLVELQKEGVNYIEICF